jgi:hypothetical protein
MNLIVYRGDVRAIGLAALAIGLAVLTILALGVVFFAAWSWLGVLLLTSAIVAGAAIWTVWSTRGPSPSQIAAASASMVMATVVGFLTVPAWIFMYVLLDPYDSTVVVVTAFLALLLNFSITFPFGTIVSSQPLAKVLLIVLIGTLLGILILASSYAGYCTTIDNGCTKD